MKILIVSEDIPQPTMGGLGRHAMTLAAALEATGQEVDVLGGDEGPFDEIRREYGFMGKFFAELRGYRLGGKEAALGLFNPVKRPVIARRVARTILRYAARYDVIHYHGHAPQIGMLVPEGVNFVQTRHDQGTDCLTHVRFRDRAICRETSARACAACATPSPNALQRAISAFTVRRYRTDAARALQRHKVIFVSRAIQQNLARTLAIAPGVVIHNFIDYQAIQRAAAPAREVRNEVVMLVAGKLWPPKGVREFLSELAGQIPEAMRVDIIGDGPDEANLRQHYACREIRFHGWHSYSATIARMSNADALVVPSIWEEPCATTILEGLALGRPVYALARGGTPELRRYERRAGQLRLFKNMAALVNAARQVRASRDSLRDGDFAGDVRHRIPQILAVYRADHNRYCEALRSTVPST